MTYSVIAPEHAEQLSHVLEAEKDSTFSAFRLHLELLGYDITDEDFVQTAQRQSRSIMRSRVNRALIEKAADNPGILGRFSALMMSFREMGEILGIPKSTVQAMACGRMEERFSKCQKDELEHILTTYRQECDALLDELLNRV